jgi:hypothetical protein
MNLKYAFSVLALIAMAHQAQASTFVITDSVTDPGSVTVTARNPANGTIAPTVSYVIGNAYNVPPNPPGPAIGGDIPGSLTASASPWNFYDDFVFTIGPSGSTIQSALITFGTAFYGISNLQGRIIGANGTFNAAANLGTPPGGTIDKWASNSTTSGGLTFVNLAGTPFGPGTYDLQIRGEVVNGAAGSGAYGGAITFTPVPLPTALPLLLSGLALFGGLRARRRTA